MKLDLNSPFSDDTHFEAEVRRLAGLIWPHGTVDRSPVVEGRERDAIVETPDIVTVIEATTSRKKDKIADDAKKTHELVRRIRSQGFACRGILVTLNEPTADQELAVKKYHGSVLLQSFDQLLARLFDASEYLRIRITKEFGSIQNPRDARHQLGREFYIPIPVLDVNEGTAHSAAGIGASVVSSSSRFVILGDFGSGKSMSLREVFYWLRDEFISKRHSRFPVYINLRDHAGAKYPDEILVRHARDLGLKESNTLVKAWRAGFIDLLLDGFDEFAAVGWSSTPFKLRQLRRTMLEAVRRLITESSNTVGIVAVGRLHYFDSIREMQEALGLAGSFQILRIDALSEEVALKIVKRYGGTSVPDWVPSRALLLSYLAATDFLKDFSGFFSSVASRGHGCGRKANAFSRGLEPRARGLVPQVLDLVQASGFAAPNRIRNQTIWFPRRDKMRRVNDMISQPSSSTDPLIDRVRNL
jgi:NACHT domain-containing protein